MILVLLVLIALVLFIVATFPVPSRVNLIALGLAFLTAAILLSRYLPALH